MASRNPNDLRQLYDIHVSFLPERAKIALKKLDTPTALCHGFRFLADRLGYSFDQITVRVITLMHHLKNKSFIEYILIIMQKKFK